MNELVEINTAFASLVADGKSAALVTVIGVAGSTYRRPGARMLVAEDGRTWGGVSGGCLDRDVARRGRQVIESGVAQRHIYDTSEDGELPAGITTGCGGTVEVFLQRVSPSEPGPMTLIDKVCRDRARQSLAIVCGTSGDVGYAVGEAIPLPLDAHDLSRLAGPTPAGDCAGVGGVFAAGLKVFSGASGTVELFVDHLAPAQSLVLFGAGPDVTPVVAIAKTLGWHVTVVASHPAMGVRERLTNVDTLHITSSDDPLDGVAIPADAAVVLMTHTYSRDLAVLSLLPNRLPYLGILGPRHRTDRLLHALRHDVPRDVLHAPVGLDLGADSPAEIALAIIAEIQSTLRRANPIPLRDRPGPIHPARDSGEAVQRAQSPACPL